jgi:Ran GTPase-activating protein (RanGAP) involved in mRNA processing and transport
MQMQTYRNRKEKKIIKDLQNRSLLQSIHLSGIYFSNDRVIKIANALTTNTILKCIILERNSIGDEGAHALAEMLKVNSSIQILSLRQNEIRCAGAQSIANSLQYNSSLKSIDLTENMIGEIGFHAIISMLEYNSTLTSLYLKIHPIRPSNQNTDPIQHKALHKNFSIQNIQISIHDLRNYECFQKLFKIIHSSIQSIDISITNIGFDGIKCLADALKLLSSSTTVNLCFKSLFGNCVLIAIYRMIMMNRSIKSLSIDGYDIGCDSITNGEEELAKILRAKSSLKTISVAGSKITLGKALISALEKNFNIENIDLSRNDIGFKGAILYSKLLNTTHPLKNINLEKNQIGVEGAQKLAAAIKVNSTIRDINLSFNDIGDEGAITIADALKFNSSLEIIHLTGNKIEYAGTRALAKALCVNNHLQIIRLGYNLIQNGGAQAIAGVLQFNDTLQAIHLEQNRIHRIGGSLILEELQSNTSIQYINLNGNRIRKTDDREIESLLLKNRKQSQLLCKMSFLQLCMFHMTNKMLDKNMIIWEMFPVIGISKSMV